jgi:hypothetical protein
MRRVKKCDVTIGAFSETRDIARCHNLACA